MSAVLKIDDYLAFYQYSYATIGKIKFYDDPAQPLISL